MYDNPMTRDKHMRKIPKKVAEWSKTLFEHSGYIYYKRSGKKTTCFCGACGAYYEGKTYADNDYEFVRPTDHIEKPVHNMDTICPYCKSKTQYKAAGKCRPTYRFFNEYCIGQDMGDSFVFRVFSVTQTMSLKQKTSYESREYMRVWLQKGKKKIKDTLVHSYWTRKTEWRESFPVSIPSFTYYPGTVAEIRKSELLKYSLKFGKNQLIEWYAAFARYPEMEFLLSFGIDDVVDRMIWQMPFGYNSRAKTPYDRFRIYKPRLKEMIEKSGDYRLMQIYQLEKRLKKHWKDDNIEAAGKLLGNSYRTGREKKLIKEILNHTDPVRAVNYIQKYADKQQEKSETKGYRGNYYFELAIRKYIDYINMRIEAGYDLDKESVIFPKNLDRRHAEMVARANKAKVEKRCQVVNEKFINIEKNYKKLSDKYSAAAAGYIIRPAKSAAEIVMEGQVLHHCVGGDFYLEKHNKGTTYILFLRSVEKQDDPYITVEIDGSKGKILQWYGAYDKKPNEAYFDAWLDTYLKELKKHEKTKATKSKKKNNKKLKETA